MTDTHNTLPSVPEGDILLHGGDLTDDGTFAELQAQLTWMNTLPHPYKVVIPGNHDLLLDEHYFERFPQDIGGRILIGKNGEGIKDLDWGDIIVLINESVTLTVNGRNLRIFGSPQTVRFGTGGFTYLIEHGRDVWHNLIPSDTDIVLTHSPQRGHLDCNLSGYHQGCAALNDEMWRVKPKVHVHGHIHEARGQEELCWDNLQVIYDHVVNGRGGMLGTVWKVIKMIGVWVWVWYEWMIGRKRVSKATIVHAAVCGRNGVGGGPPRVIEI
jgi:calcineurin-like phosphoesterase family protein